MAGTGGETITRSLEMGEHQERTLGMPGDTDWDGTERRDGDERRTRERREYSEATDIAIEARSLSVNPEAELAELAHIYERRGLKKDLAQKVAQALHDHDAIGAHARDELGIDHEALPNPSQAALASAVAFSFGSMVPIVAAIIADDGTNAWLIVAFSMLALAVSGGIGAYIGGGRKRIAALRVFIGGGAAMAITAFIGHLIGQAL